uniref:Putative secreted protein n=1 Tax=Anopheles triannulatus TaxID=58253 RepID=A0A2M4B0Y6_9DIPT
MYRTRVCAFVVWGCTTLLLAGRWLSEDAAAAVDDSDSDDDDDDDNDDEGACSNCASPSGGWPSQTPTEQEQHTLSPPFH